jgi:hypothetical protein
MMPPLRKLLAFVLLFLPLFLLCFAAYVWLFPRYDPLVMRAANAIMLQMSPPTHLAPRRDKPGWEAFAWSPEKGQERIRSWNPATAHLSYLSAVTLPALLLATPAPLRSRFLLLVLALPLLFASHVTSAILITRGVYCVGQTPREFECMWALRIAYTSGQLFAATFWILVSWRYWFVDGGRKREPRARAEAGRAGSGLSG